MQWSFPCSKLTFCRFLIPNARNLVRLWGYQNPWQLGTKELEEKLEELLMNWHNIQHAGTGSCTQLSLSYQCLCHEFFFLYRLCYYDPKQTKTILSQVEFVAHSFLIKVHFKLRVLQRVGATPPLCHMLEIRARVIASFPGSCPRI